MVNSELVATLRVFSKQEKHRLKLFMQSPYCTDGKDATKEWLLVNQIMDALALGPDGASGLKKKVLYAGIFSQRDYVPQTLNNLATSALKYVRKFIVAQMGNDLDRPIHNQTQLLRFFREKGDYDLCNKYLQRLEREIAANNSPDPVDYMQRWQAEDIKSDFLGMKTEQKGDFNLKEALNALDQFYLTKRVEMLTTIFNQNALSPILTENEAEMLLREVDAWSDKPVYRHPLIQLSRKVLVFLHTNGPEAEAEFAEFRAMLADEEANLSLYYLKRFESLAYNFCVRRFREKTYREILFDLLRRRIHPDRLNKEGTIQHIELLSLIKTGILGKEFELVQTLLDTFKNKIKGPQPSTLYEAFCQAFIYFHTGRFQEAYQLILHLNFHDTSYKYVHKMLEIKLLFEATDKDFDLIESKLMAFRVALTRERNVASEKILVQRNFVNTMLHLNNWCRQPSKNWDQLEAMYQEVVDNPMLSERIWLIQKLKELLSAAPAGAVKPEAMQQSK
ncbi:MAG: hypothetical protein R3D58_05215 [Saprospiraceae bacterium]|jgi:hypothetical protein|nr:hypothetical protein [Lewinellaceae bacterium]